MKSFTLITSDRFIWNRNELLKFLIDNQYKDITIFTNGEGCCSTSNGLYSILDQFEFKSVTINTTNTVEQNNKYNILINSHSFKFFEVTGNYTEYHQWNKKYLYGALYNRAIWHRIGLASHLMKNHEDISLINFRSNPHDVEQRTLFELQTLFENDIDSVKNFTQVLDRFPIQVESTDGYTVGATTKEHTDQLKSFYLNFLIDIVAETFTSGRTFFPTEKTVRPILMKKPFIIMGPKCFLIHLRQMGFKTFYEFWDESYDGFDGAQKYKKILSLIDDLSKKPISDVETMYINMQDILDHNYNLLIKQNYNKKITYVD